MSTLLAIAFWIFVYYCWREGRKPTCEITGKEIAKQEALIATLKDRALGKHPKAYVHTAMAKEEAALRDMHRRNAEWYEMQKAAEERSDD